MMNLPTTENLVPCLGWTLVHFLWQGLAIAVWLMLCLRLLRSGAANQRYLAGCAALVAMVLAPVITFSHLAKDYQSQPPALAADMIPSAPAEAVRSEAEPRSKTVVTFKAVPVKVSSVERLERGLPWLVIAWAAGVFTLSGRLLIGWLQVRRLTRNAAVPLEGLWQERLTELANRLSVSRPVRLLQSALVEVPTVIGWLRPVILLPASCLAGLTTAQLEAVLAHELAHIRRHDYFVNLLQSVVETLLFYHPAVWWVSRCIRQEREHCCDDLAVRTCGDRVAYARALATLEELRLLPPQLAVAAGGAPLLERIHRLAGRSDKEVGRPGWLVAVMLSITAAMALLIAFRSSRALAEEKKASNLAAEIFRTPAEMRATEVAAAALVQEGKLLFEAGKMDEAETKLTQAQKQDPQNVAAQYYLVLISEKRSAEVRRNAERKTGGLGARDLLLRQQDVENLRQKDSNDPLRNLAQQAPNLYARTNRTYTSKGRQSILSKLDRIRIDSVKYDGLPLAEVIKDLSEIAKSRDPDKVGINFFINRYNPAAAATAPSGVDPTTGLPVAALPTETVDVGAIRVNINPPLTNASLADVLDAITKTAEKPVKFSIEDYAIVFSLKGPESVQLFTRVFHFDPNKFRQILDGITSDHSSSSNRLDNAQGNLAAGTNSYTGLQAQVRQFFSAAGIDFSPANPANIRKTIFLNERKGTLMVHATAEDLDIIAAAIEAFTPPPPAYNYNFSQPTLELVPTIANPGLSGALSALREGTSPQYAGQRFNIVGIGAAGPETMFTRIFGIDVTALSQGLNRLAGMPMTKTNSAARLEALRQYLADSGVDFGPNNPTTTGKSVSYSEASGKLTVRGTPEDLSIVDEAIVRLKQRPPEINIKAEFVEITEKADSSNGFNFNQGFFVKMPISNAPAGLPKPPVRTRGLTNVLSDSKHPVTNSVIAQMTGVMTAPAHAVVRHALQMRDGVDLLTCPEVTTESDRQAQIQVVDMVTVVTGVNPVPKGKALSTNDFITQVIPVGPVLDVIPHAKDDGRFIEVTITATVTEFLGYEDPKGRNVEVSGGKAALPLPQFRVRQLKTSAVVQDGQTIVLGGLAAESLAKTTDKVPVLGDVPLLGRLFRTTSSTKVKKNLLVFVTPTLINPDGSRYRSEEKVAVDLESGVR